MQNQSFIERRAFPRFPVTMPVSYFEPDANTTVDARTYDISAKGLCMVTDKELSAGADLDIYLKMLDNGEQIYRKGRVVWSNMLADDKYRVGIKLEEPQIKPIPIVLRTINSRR